MSFWTLLTVLAALLILIGAPRWVPGRHRSALLVLMALTGAGALGMRLLDVDRWQLVPLYVLVAIALLVGALQLRRGAPPARRRLRRGFGIFGGMLLTLVAVLPVLAFPLFDLPAPSGPLQVGVTDIHLVDPSRPDPFKSRPSGRRELMVRAWYPATAKAGPPAPYMSQRTVNALVGGQLPVFLFGHLPLVGTSGHQDAPVAGSGRRLPVIVFVPGFRSFVSQSTALAQDLASNGYVVLSLGAPATRAPSSFPTGRSRRSSATPCSTTGPEPKRWRRRWASGILFATASS